jgi:hypothetical protein
MSHFAHQRAAKKKLPTTPGGLICTASDEYYNRSATWRFAVPKGHPVALRLGRVPIHSEERH